MVLLSGGEMGDGGCEKMDGVEEEELILLI